MKLRAHNSTADTSCEEHDHKYQPKITRKRGHKNLKENLANNKQPSKENINLNVQVEKGTKNEKSKDERIQSRREMVEKDPVADYEKQILSYVIKRQEQNKILPQNIRNHESFSTKNRRSTIRYFFKVAKKHKLKRTTIHLAVFYMDSYLQQKQFLQKMTYIAQATLFIAMKYEQIYPPELYEWTSHCKNVIVQEADVLKTLDFNLAYTTLQHFYQYYSSKIKITESDRKMIELLLDVCLFDQSMYKERPNQLALNIIYSVIRPQKLQQKVSMNLKWMLQRCQGSMQWLQENYKY